MFSASSTEKLFQTQQATGVDRSTVYKIRSEVKTTGGLDILFLDFFFIPEVYENIITEGKEK